jgi:hypothetical protein
MRAFVFRVETLFSNRCFKQVAENCIRIALFWKGLVRNQVLVGVARLRQPCLPAAGAQETTVAAFLL